MADVTRAHRAVIARVLRGDGRASPALRRAAFDNAGLAAPVSALINKVTIHASKISDADIAAARTAGLNEDQIFEIVVCAALGQATRQYCAALDALAAATGPARAAG